MLKLSDGQCGMCSHFGEHDDANHAAVVQVRINGEASEGMLEPCGLPGNEGLHLRVSPIGCCDGFTPAMAS